MTACVHDVHLREDCIECEKSAAYAQGRADERAAIVAWLRVRDREYSVADDCADSIECGEHEKKTP